MLNMHLSIELMAIWQIVVFVCGEVLSAIIVYRTLIDKAVIYMVTKPKNGKTYVLVSPSSFDWENKEISTLKKWLLFSRELLLYFSILMVLTYFWIEIIF